MNCVVSASDILAVSKSHTTSTAATCCNVATTDTHSSLLSVPVSADCLVQPPLGSLTSECNSVADSGLFQSSVLSSPSECKPEDFHLCVGREASSATSSSLELPFDTVIACSASYCML